MRAMSAAAPEQEIFLLATGQLAHLRPVDIGPHMFVVRAARPVVLSPVEKFLFRLRRQRFG